MEMNHFYFVSFINTYANNSVFVVNVYVYVYNGKKPHKFERERNTRRKKKITLKL